MSAPEPAALVRLLEDIESRAWRDVHASAQTPDVTALGLRPAELGGGLLMTADRVESLLFNRALGLGLHEPLTAATLDAVLAHYRDGAPGFALNLCPLAARAGLENDLHARGFATFFHHLKWVRGTAPAPEARTDLRITTATPAEAGTWGALAARIHDTDAAQAAWSARGVGRPGWTHLFAYDGDTPVAVGAVYVHNDAAWLGMGATLESHRRRGAQGALFAARIRIALEQGARWLTTETAPDWPDLPGESVRNARRAGFHPGYERPSWIWPVS
ncbi:MAG: GNAT family N-acetyltransferase [Candidatus Eisenbacteria bacterium]